MPETDPKPGQHGEYWLSHRPGSPYWHRTWFDSAARQTRRVSLGTADFQDACDRLATWFVENRIARNEQPSAVLIETLMTRDYALRGKHMKSAESVRASLGYWTAYFIGATLADITPTAVKAFTVRLRDLGKSNGYIRRILADGRAAFNGALERGEITLTPYISGKLAPEGKPRERVLTLGEMARLIDAATVPHLRRYLLLAIATMARPEAITDLTAQSINWENGTINLLPKGMAESGTKRRPVVPIVSTIRPMLANIPVGPLITYEGGPLKSTRSAFEKAVAKAGLEASGVNRYCIRHTVISEAMKRCSDPWQVEAFAGHRTGHKTTARYVHWTKGYLAKAAAAIDEYFEDIAAEMETSLLDHIGLSALQLRSSNTGKLVEPSGIEPLTSTLPV